jgi:hypothetical protein
LNEPLLLSQLAVYIDAVDESAYAPVALLETRPRRPAREVGAPTDLCLAAYTGHTRSITVVPTADAFLCRGWSDMEMSIGQSLCGSFVVLRGASDCLRLATARRFLPQWGDQQYFAGRNGTILFMTGPMNSVTAVTMTVKGASNW